MSRRVLFREYLTRLRKGVTSAANRSSPGPPLRLLSFQRLCTMSKAPFNIPLHQAGPVLTASSHHLWLARSNLVLERRKAYDQQDMSCFCAVYATSNISSLTQGSSHLLPGDTDRKQPLVDDKDR